jgi:cell division transport system permease protein
VLDYNPLPASIDFYLQTQYVNKDSINNIIQDLQTNIIISEIKYPDAVVNNLNSVVRRVGIFLLSVAAVLSVIVII